MTTKRVLHCTLILMVLVTAGCGWFSGSSSSPEANSAPNNNSSSTPQPPKTINFGTAEGNIRDAVRRLETPTRTGPSSIVKAVKGELNKAVEELGTDNDALARRCADCKEETINEAAKVLEELNRIKDDLGADTTTIAQLDTELKTTVRTGLLRQADKLKTLGTKPLKTTEESSPSSSVAQVAKKDDTSEPAWWSIFIFPLQIVAGLLALVLLTGAVAYLWNRAWKRLEINVARIVKAHAAADRNGQPDYTSKLSSLSSTQSEMNTKLIELDTEVRSLARFVRESLARRPDHNPSYGDSNHQSQINDVSLKDEPEFPVAAVDYLGKMNRFATVVRPDFQNGILVNDPDGTGELVLIRDSRQSDDTQPLFVVPSATQFHTKQDFYTYYQKYYECVRPQAGAVWIIGPAVVQKVTGGWQLREKGMLEIR